MKIRPDYCTDKGTFLFLKTKTFSNAQKLRTVNCFLELKLKINLWARIFLCLLQFIKCSRSENVGEKIGSTVNPKVKKLSKQIQTDRQQINGLWKVEAYSVHKKSKPQVCLFSCIKLNLNVLYPKQPACGQIVQKARFKLITQHFLKARHFSCRSNKN